MCKLGLKGLPPGDMKSINFNLIPTPLPDSCAGTPFSDQPFSSDTFQRMAAFCHPELKQISGTAMRFANPEGTKPSVHRSSKRPSCC